MVPTAIRIQDKKVMTILLSIVFSISFYFPSFSQSKIDSLFGKLDPQRWAASIEKKADKLQEKIIAKSQKMLTKLQKQEEKIYRKMLKGKDSLMAKAQLAGIKSKYQSLRDKIKNPAIASGAKQYISKLDSLTTSLKFLDQNGMGGKVKDALAKTEALQDKFQQAEEIKKFIRERRQQLKEQLQNLGMVKELKKFNKGIYYYSNQIQEYKETLKDSKKRERKALELLSKTKLFKDFMRKNGMLAGLFRMPNPDEPLNAASLSGLQTRVQVNNLIQQQIGAGGPNAQAQFSQNVQDAQSQLNELKNKVSKLGGGSSDMEMPEGFKPNFQKTKSFLQRIKLNADFQTTRHNNLFPVNSDVGLSIGYKLHEKSMIAIGSSFKLGWGTGINHIRLTSQGVSIRGGIDWRLKGNLFVAGNYEQNYFSEINNISQLRSYSSWKTAALLGLSKKYKSGKGKGGEIKLFYDFFYNRPPIRTQPLIVRFAYNLK